MDTIAFGFRGPDSLIALAMLDLCASTKELMSRMGQSSSRAALIDQHATQDRDAAIADSLSSMIKKHRFATS